MSQLDKYTIPKITLQVLLNHFLVRELYDFYEILIIILAILHKAKLLRQGAVSPGGGVSNIYMGFIRA